MMLSLWQHTMRMVASAAVMPMKTSPKWRSCELRRRQQPCRSAALAGQPDQQICRTNLVCSEGAWGAVWRGR